jgi:hypothetical protein
VARRRAKPSGARRTSKPSTNAAPRRERSAQRSSRPSNLNCRCHACHMTAMTRVTPSLLLSPHPP